MSKKNVLTRFREFWNTLDNGDQKDLWDVLTALRGDDDETSLELKLFVTARIRGELFRVKAIKVLPLGGYICPTIHDSRQEFTEGSLPNLKELFKKASEHWKTHAQRAIRVINKLHPSRSRDLKKFERMSKW